MRFDIYGKDKLEVIRDGDRWKVFSTGDGTRIPRSDVVIPAEVGADEVGQYLDDLFHELAGPGQTIRRIG